MIPSVARKQNSFLFIFRGGKDIWTIKLMNSRIQDVTRFVKFKVWEQMLFCVLHKENKKTKNRTQTPETKSKAEDWPSESGALNRDRCFCRVDGLHYGNIRGCAAHLSNSFSEADTCGGGRSPLLSSGPLKTLKSAARNPND